MLRHHEIESSACPCSSRLTQFSAGLSWTIPSGDNRVTPTNAPNTTEIKELNNEQQDIHYRNKVQIPAATIQLQNRTPWARLAPCQSLDNIDRDEQEQFIPPTCGTSPIQPDSEEFTSNYTDSTQSSQFVFSPATWTPQESNQNTRPITPTTPPSEYNENRNSVNMADILNCSFTGKLEDKDPQDFMNQLERILLMKTGLTEIDKVCFLELSLKAKSSAQAWFTTLKKVDKVSFTTARDAFKICWPVKAITEKTTA